jgi:hypothetical protein
MQYEHLCLYRPGGAHCELSLEQGDLFEQRREAPADLLLISAFRHDYWTGDHSAIAGLKLLGLDVKFDLKPAAVMINADCWISKELASNLAQRVGARRILCYEGVHREGVDSLRSLFSALLIYCPIARSVPKRIIMPVICSGDQGVDPEHMMRLIISGFEETFALGMSVSSVRIFERSENKASALQREFSQVKKKYSPFAFDQNPKQRYDLFFSYSHKDRELIDAIYQPLKRSTMLRLFRDIDGGVHHGDVLSRDLANAVRASRCVVAFLSPDYISSPNCQIEFSAAYCHKHFAKNFELKPLLIRGEVKELPGEYRDVIFKDCTCSGALAKDIVAEIANSASRLRRSKNMPPAKSLH